MHAIDNVSYGPCSSMVRTLHCECRNVRFNSYHGPQIKGITMSDTISTEELLAILKDRLSINIEFKPAGRAYFDGDHQLTVLLKLDGETISSSGTSIPNTTREREY